MADPSDRNPNPEDRRDQANTNDPNRDKNDESQRRQQQADQARQNQQGAKPDAGKPEDQRDTRKPQQQS